MKKDYSIEGLSTMALVMKIDFALKKRFSFFNTLKGNTVSFSYVREVGVKEDDTVVRGILVAKAWNNGYSRDPHINNGA